MIFGTCCPSSVALLLLLCVSVLAAPAIDDTADAEDAEVTGWDDWQLLRKPQVDGRIVGGSLAPITSFPYQLSLRYNKRHVCGAAIISEHFAITAAHCMELSPSSVKRLSLKAGSAKLYRGGSEHRAAAVFVHPKFDAFAQDFDVAVIQVKEPFVLTSLVSPVRLPTPDSRLAVGTMAIVTGWGVTREGSFTPALQLQFVSVPVVAREECAVSYAPYGRITDRMMCAGYDEGQRDACQGDSGGPLVSNGVLVGVVSWGAGCARPGLPGVYTNLAEPSLRAWVSEHTAGL